MLDKIIFALGIVITLHVIFKNREIVKQLTALQIVGVSISYIITVFVGSVCIYFGGNWLAEQSSNIFLEYIIFIAVVCATLYICISILRKVLKSITNGVLPKS